MTHLCFPSHTLLPDFLVTFTFSRAFAKISVSKFSELAQQFEHVHTIELHSNTHPTQFIPAHTHKEFIPTHPGTKFFPITAGTDVKPPFINMYH